MLHCGDSDQLRKTSMQIDVAIVLAAISAIVGGVSAVASMVSARAAARQVRLMVEEMEKRERP